MAVIDVSTLETRYLDFCKGQEVPTNSAILSGFTKAKLQKGSREQCSMQVFLDQLRDTDFPPLTHAVTEIDSSDIEAVDIIQESPSVLNSEYVLSLMHAVDQKLRRVDLHDLCLGKDFVRDLFHHGLSCEILNLRSSHVRKLNMVGKFMNLRTLNLDFSISITGFQEDCFNCMPNLMRISMCETRVSNLWTTCSSLSKLPSLVELRFQNCLCCNDTAACSTSSTETPNTIASNTSPLDHPARYSTGSPSIISEGLLFQNSPDYQRELSFGNFLVDDLSINQGSLENLTEDSSDDSEVEFSRRDRRMGLDDLLSNMFPELRTRTVAENEVYSDTFFPAEDETILTRALDLIQTTDASPKKFIPHHPSPICFEKLYREYLVVSLPRLKVLDNLPITETERDMSNIICAQYYEFLPYNRQRKENLVSIMQEREKGSKQSNCVRKSKHFYSRSISAAKVGSSAWPLIHPLSKISSIENEESKKFRPRQFEYHPSDPSLMVFGTLDGEIVVINHESGNVVGYSASGMLNSVLGLCWLKSYPSKLIAGSDNGSLQLYDVRRMSPAVTDRQCTANISKFDDFENLTSVHVNSTDDQFIASGYSKDVSLYDIGSGKKLQTFTDMHRGHINVVKFAHHSPSMFVTSSFDHDVKMWDLRERPRRPCYTASSSRGNVMVCFSPDDHYLLASAVDNEVRQLLAVDGRVNLKFEIASSGSSQNYTRSYYMNGRDYIISGSSDEQVVRVCCAQTGRRLRDIPLETTRLGNSMFVQSLRGDPFRDFHMSVLAAYMRPSSKSEIIKVNLMSTSEHYNESSYSHNSLPYSNMGA